MNCQNKIMHRVMMGDNLYKLALYYQTSVPQIIADNPHINPQNMRIGSMIAVCPGSTYPANVIGEKQLRLSNEMRMAWEQHVAWMRMFIISTVENLPDASDVTNRLLKNPKDIANIFKEYYGESTAQAIDRLLTEHLTIGDELVTALKNGDAIGAEDANKRWYMNADNIATALASINPNYNREEMRTMLYRHLDLMKNEVSLRLNDQYAEDIKAYDIIEKQALEMADALAKGIVEQFPYMFM